MTTDYIAGWATAYICENLFALCYLRANISVIILLLLDVVSRHHQLRRIAARVHTRTSFFSPGNRAK